MRRKIVFAKLFNQTDTYSPEILFEVFRWMLATGWDYRGDNPYRTQGVFEQLWGLSSVNSQGYWYYQGFKNYDKFRNEMLMAFMRAIISEDCRQTVKEWRVKECVGIGQSRHLNLQISDEIECAANNKLYKLLNEAQKRKLTVQLNPCWKQAVNIDHVLLTAHKDGWQAILNYGFDGSFWTHTLAEQGKNTFGDFLAEACRELGRITSVADGEGEEQA